MSADVLQASVVVPTVGRPELLAACLDSIARCRPRAAEVLVIDQSAGRDVREVVEPRGADGVRLIGLEVRNKPRALNLGLAQARHEVVLVTDDDCTVDREWVRGAHARIAANKDLIVTGRVLAMGDPAGVPSTVDDPTRRDFTGKLEYGALYGGNMACNRTPVLAVGGFDERFEAAEDNDLCYRWLRAGYRLYYEPELVVWHHAWRSPEEMRRLYFAYGKGQGAFYAKHLGRGDLRVMRFLVRDLYRGARGMTAAVVKEREPWPDPRIGLIRGVLVGLTTRGRTSSEPRP